MDSYDNHRRKTLDRLPTDTAGVVEKICNKPSYMKLQETYYDYVVINGVKKRVVKSCHYNESTGVLKESIIYLYNNILLKRIIDLVKNNLAKI